MATITSVNPSTYKVIGKVESSSEEEVKLAVDKAREAFGKWSRLSLEERKQAIRSFMKACAERKEDIAQAMSRDMGKPIKTARAQVDESFDYFNAYFDMADEALSPEVVLENASEKHILYREPLGVIAAITPWNFPFLNIPWQFGQALIAGNTVVYKPSEETVLYAKLIAEIIETTDLTGGVLNVIIGDGKVGELLVQQPIDAILFTGSTKTGQRITELAAKTSTPVFTEMGGSAPGIVFEDADVDKVIETIYDMRFDNTGQYCDGLKRLMVHEDKLDEVLQALSKINATRKVGNASSEDTNLGPLVAKRQLDLLEDQVKDALNKGARVFFGGKRPDDLNGAYYLPTVLTEISFDMRVWTEEVFGPVLPIVTFNTDDEAIKLANDTSYGLGAFVFTEDRIRYLKVAKQIQSGIVAHNNALYYHPACPFGGYKKSGNSRTSGIEGFHEVTKVKLISEEK